MYAAKIKLTHNHLTERVVVSIFFSFVLWKPHKWKKNKRMIIWTIFHWDPERRKHTVVRLQWNRIEMYWWMKAVDGQFHRKWNKTNEWNGCELFGQWFLSVYFVCLIKQFSSLLKTSCKKLVLLFKKDFNENAKMFIMRSTFVQSYKLQFEKRSMH